MRRLPVKADTVFYESFAGNGMLCNPEAIFRALLEADDMRHLTHIWALDDLGQYASTIAEFSENPRVKFVRAGSIAYHIALCTAKYLVNNATFSYTFAKRPGQVYLNTWHGTPLKAMGYDMPNGAVDSRNVLRNLLACDFLLAPNDATASMYLDAYRMTNVFRGAMIHEGTPRIDLQFSAADRKARIRERLLGSGVDMAEGRKIVLYAPTWKGDFYAPNNDIKQLRNRIQALRARIDTTKYVVLLKVHQQVYQFATRDAELRSLLVSNDVPANDALAVTDVLITDYSSIFVDFLATGRPVLFYTPDLGEYQETRGLNVPVNDWPGPICVDIDGLARLITAIGTGSADDATVSHAEQYRAAKQRYCPLEDGHAAERVVDIVFRDKGAGYDVRTEFSDGRETLLIYLGGILPNGITMSALSLLDNVDYSRFDVSIFYMHATQAYRAALIDQVNPNVRLIPRSGAMLAHKTQVHSLTRGSNRSAARSHAADVSRYGRVLRDEWERCFGDARFDYVVDFSGYSPLWTKVLLQGSARSMAIWQHNDLRADSNREVGGSHPHRANLEGMFELYRYADHLVSVSPSLAAINRNSLGEFAEPEKFTWARNTINHQRVLALAYGVGALPNDAFMGTPPRHLLVAGELPPDVADDAYEPPDEGVDVARPLPLGNSIEKVLAEHDIEAVLSEVQRRAEINRILPPAPGSRTFVTASRLSPEKNHARLIRAFDLVHQEDPNTRLVILGGGPLRDALDNLVSELGLRAAVNIAGHQPNPYGVMAQSDCFVMSSEYEGQPMVLLEALVLGLPVITTKFPSVADALPQGCGRIVDASVDGLADGMRAFLRGEVLAAPFDYREYNRETTAEFYRAIGAVAADAS